MAVLRMDNVGLVVSDMDAAVDFFLAIGLELEGRGTFDTVWPSEGVIYSQRLSAERTKSRLNRIMASPLYKSMTIRSWQTTLALLDLMRQR